MPTNAAPTRDLTGIVVHDDALSIHLDLLLLAPLSHAYERVGGDLY